MWRLIQCKRTVIDEFPVEGDINNGGRFFKSVGCSFLLLSLFPLFPERREINLVNRIKPKK